MALPFSQWTREAKDEFAQKRMEEMKLKNEAFKQRYAEVEQDRMKAEAKDSAVTSVKISKKENIIIEKEKVEDIPKVSKEREWDKGKIDQDADDWSPPKFHGYRSRAQRRNFPDRRAPKKEENWRVRSANLSKDRQSYSKFRSSGPNKFQESFNCGTSSFRNENVNFSRQRGRVHRTSGGTYRSFQNSRFDEPRKKSISGGAGSASPSLSDSELEPIKPPVKSDVARMWQDGGITEVVHKQSRVEKWVKAINSSWNEEYDNVKGNDYHTDKRGEAGSQDVVTSYGYAKEEGYSKKAQSSRDQPLLKNRDRYDGSKYGQSSRGSARASRTPTGERTVGGLENKNQKDFRKKNYSDKNRFRRESDLSDRTSSMKESDYHEYSKDKFNKTASDSKSSDYSGKWEDEECEFKYVSEKKPFDKQPSACNYDKDKFNKPKSVRTSSVSGSQDGMKNDGFDDEILGMEYFRNTRQKFPSNYAKDQHSDNRPGARKGDYSFNKIKTNKYKTDSKFVGHSGKVENDSAADNHARASRKYKMNKPSPKRTLSNPVKSVDTSSSASKTMEFNSPDDDVWGDYDDSGVPWKLDENNGNQTKHKSIVEEKTDMKKVSQPLNSKFDDTDMRGNSEDSSTPWKENNNNGSKTEYKSSLAGEKADVNEVFQPLNSNTVVMTDCDASSEKFFENDKVRNRVSVPEELRDDNIVAEHNIEVREKKVLNSLGEFIESGTLKNFADVAENRKLMPNDPKDDNNEENAVSTCLSESIDMVKLGAETSCNILTDEKHEGMNDNNEYSGHQNEAEVTVQQLTFDQVSSVTSDVINSVDSESKNPAEILTNESKSYFPEISEVVNSQDMDVQSTETGQTYSKLPSNTNLKHSNLDVAIEKYDVNDLSPINVDCETPVKPTVENDAVVTVHNELTASSSQGMNASSPKDDSKSALKSSDIVAEPQLSKCEENNIENSSGALILSDDGGWSTVSEDENNDASDVEKTDKESNSAIKTLT